jgi:hypothetical protein
VTATLKQRDLGAAAVGEEVVAERPRVGAALTVALVTCVVGGAVLRVLWARHYGLSFDETFTAMAGRRSVGDLVAYIREADSHPPLDTLLRSPLAHAGVGNFEFRIPSLVFSVAALALFAWWMRTRGVAGLAATAVFALSGFAVLYGSEARMYALLQLVGVGAAMTADSWLRAPRRFHAVLVGCLVLIGCLDHSSMFLLAAGLLAVPGFRNDREAWRWRAAIAVGGVAWAVLWGVPFLDQVQGQHSSWIPPTTARAVLDGVVSLVTFTDGVKLVVAVAIVAGAILLARTDRTRFRVLCTCGALPIAMAAIIGMFSPFFLNRTLTLMLWAPILAVGVAVGAVWDRWRPLGITAFAALLLLTASGTADSLRGVWEYDLSIDRVVATARPGDVVAVVPTWYAPLVDWRVAVREPLGPTARVRLRSIADSVAYRVEGAPATGRIVLLEFGASHPDLSRFDTCAHVWTFDSSRVRCLVTGAAR